MGEKGAMAAAAEVDAVGGAKQQGRRPAEGELEQEEPPQVGGCMGRLGCMSIQVDAYRIGERPYYHFYPSI